MAHKTRIDGTAYTLCGGRVLADGTGYVAASGKTMVDGTAYTIGFSGLSPAFADNDWQTIITACQSGQVPESWAIGSSKTMTIGGADYRIDIIGKNHDDYADGSGKAPLTLMLHPAYDGSYRMHSTAQALYGVAAWRDCEMRTATLPAILAQLPKEVQGAVREVSKLAGAWLYGSPQAVTDRLFLLSEIEITGTERYSGKAEGTQYEYYQTAANRIKTGRESENAVYWWTRSIQDEGTTFGIQIRSDGVPEASNVTSDVGLSFAFCF